MDDELYEKGIAIREEMLGPEHGRAKGESQPDGSLLVCEQVTSSSSGSGRTGYGRSRPPAPGRRRR
jgi:hypothetical protein